MNIRVYPAEITAEILQLNATRTESEILRDIGDTEAEIEDLEKIRVGELVAATSPAIGTAGQVQAGMRAEARLTGIAERREFIRFLKALLAAKGGVRVKPDLTQHTPPELDTEKMAAALAANEQRAAGVGL